MEVKSAVRLAKSYISDLLAEEGITNLGLEEIQYDEDARVWRVTLGFSRPWNTVRNALTAISGESAPKRAFRVVSIKDSGEVVSVLRRDSASD